MTDTQKVTVITQVRHVVRRSDMKGIPLSMYLKRPEILAQYDKAHDKSVIPVKKRNLVALSDHLATKRSIDGKKVGFNHARKITPCRNSDGVWIGAK